jgi:hypothetical protein
VAKKKTTDSASPAAPARSRTTTPRRTTTSTSTPRQRTRTVSAVTEVKALAHLEAAGPYSPSYDEIAQAAYHRYLSRGGRDGTEFDDWVEAERELRSRQTR